MIELNNFCLQYRKGNERALDTIDLHVRQGEFVVIVGPTGCGKTTLLRALAGLIKREQTKELSGIARINGIPISKINDDLNNHHVGIQFQNPDDQITGWTPREEVMFGLENIGLTSEEISRKVEESLELADLGDKADIPIEKLSGGQKQRLVSAAVVAMEPDVILLDEPTSNLDLRSRARLIEYLKKLKNKGLTTIVATHEPDDFFSVCDRIVSMEHGRIRNKDVKLNKTELESVNRNSKLRITSDKRYQTKNDQRQFLTLENVVTGFKKSTFRLGPVTTAFRQGEITALIGPNGGGKTTFLQLLAGLLKPLSGRIEIDGEDWVSKRKRSLYEKVAFVTQNPDLTLHSSTVRKELTARSRYLNLTDNQRFSLDNLLKLFNLQGLEDRHPFSLSQGQRQRLALGSAISGGAEILLIDEPTTGQDARQVSLLLDALKTLSDEGMTTVLSTHNLKAAKEIADRVLLLKGGSIVRDEQADTLMTNQDLLENTLLHV